MAGLTGDFMSPWRKSKIKDRRGHGQLRLGRLSPLTSRAGELTVRPLPPSPPATREDHGGRRCRVQLCGHHCRTAARSPAPPDELLRGRRLRRMVDQAGCSYVLKVRRSRMRRCSATTTRACAGHSGAQSLKEIEGGLELNAGRAPQVRGRRGARRRHPCSAAVRRDRTPSLARWKRGDRSEGRRGPPSWSYIRAGGGGADQAGCCTEAGGPRLRGPGAR